MVWTGAKARGVRNRVEVLAMRQPVLVSRSQWYALLFRETRMRR
jgi:hypothetical protein